MIGVMRQFSPQCTSILIFPLALHTKELFHTLDDNITKFQDQSDSIAIVIKGLQHYKLVPGSSDVGGDWYNTWDLREQDAPIHPRTNIF